MTPTLHNIIRRKRHSKNFIPVICLCIGSILIFSSILSRIPKNHSVFHGIPDRNEKVVLSGMHGLIGGLGNKLFEMVSLIGISRSLNRIAAVNVVNKVHISTMVALHEKYPKLVGQFQFKLISEEDIHEEHSGHLACCRFDDPMKFDNDSHDNLFLIGAYRQSFKYFETMRSEVRDWLSPTFNDSIEAMKLVPEASKNDFKICVHSRRGDFKTDGFHEPTNPLFARLATDFIVAKHKKSSTNTNNSNSNESSKITVLLLSNDADFSQAVFEDRIQNKKPASNRTLEFKKELGITYPSNSPKYTAILISDTVPYVDLALSRAFCDVVLITAPSSTFGWWLGYLAKPNATVYYRNIEETRDMVQKEMDQEDFYPPNWIRLGNNSKGEIVMK